MKFSIGVICSSQAMIADAIHSSEDVISSAASYVGIKISSKPKDESHPYGHGKIEYIFSLLISISMIIASFTMLKECINSIIEDQRVSFSIWLIIISTINILMKFILYIYTKLKYIKNNDILLKAAMEDHRNDMLLTSCTIISSIFSYYNISVIDGLIGSGISIWILLVGIRLFIFSYNVLIDTSMSKEIHDEITNEILKNNHITNIDSLISKPVGDKYILILRVSMKKEKTINESHVIAKEIKNNLLNKNNSLIDIVTHINPN